MTAATTPHTGVTVWNEFDTDSTIIGTDDEYIVYSETIPGDLLVLPLDGSGEPFLTLEIINQIPGLLTAIAEQLRTHWTIPGEYATQADADHARRLRDVDLVEQWTVAFASAGNEGLPFEILLDDFEYLREILYPALQAKFPTLIWGCGGPLPEANTRIPRTALAAGIDAHAAHERLVAAVPAWGQFLVLIAPTSLFRSTSWTADELSGVPV